MNGAVWLVTGSARGLGRAIIEAGLAAGNKVKCRLFVQVTRTAFELSRRGEGRGDGCSGLGHDILTVRFGKHLRRYSVKLHTIVLPLGHGEIRHSHTAYFWRSVPSLSTSAIC